MPEARIPLMIDTPDKNVMNTDKLESKQTPGWAPYQYKYRTFVIHREEEWKMPYARYRKSLIATEKTVEDNMLAKAAGMGRSKSMGGYEASSGFEAL